MAKISKKDLLKLELAEAEAGEKVVELKAKRPACKTCGRPTPSNDLTEKQAETVAALDAAKAELREARQKFREARDDG